MAVKSTGKHRGRPREFCTDDALEAATRVFADKGFEGASLTDLTEAMGINRTSLYATFGNKEALFRAAMERYAQEATREIEVCLSCGSAKDAVENLMRETVLRFTDPQGPGVCFVTQGPLGGDVATQITQRCLEEKHRAFEAALQDRFARAAQDGELQGHQSPDDLARYYAVVVLGLALEAQHGRSREELLRVVDVAMRQWPSSASGPVLNEPIETAAG